MSTIRVSVAGLLQLRVPDGRYALLLNWREYQQNLRIYTPIGGVLQAIPEGIRRLESLGASNFERGGDLRFHIDFERDWERVRDWLLRRTLREISPIREMRKELVTEWGLLEPTDLHGVETEPFDTMLIESISPRTNTRTMYIIEVSRIINANHQAQIIQKLYQASQKPNPIIYFATIQEILVGKANNGTKIGSNSKTLLPPHYLQFR